MQRAAQYIVNVGNKTFQWRHGRLLCKLNDIYKNGAHYMYVCKCICRYVLHQKWAQMERYLRLAPFYLNVGSDLNTHNLSLQVDITAAVVRYLIIHIEYLFTITAMSNVKQQ